MDFRIVYGATMRTVSENNELFFSTYEFWLNSFVRCRTECDNWLIEPKLCKTNIPPQTHTRAPGGCEAAFFIETAMEHAAHSAGIDPFEFRRNNYYKDGDTTFHGEKEERDGKLEEVTVDTATEELLRRIDYEARKREIVEFNANSKYKACTSKIG